MGDQPENDKNIEMWKIKKLMKNLEAARGNGTSMISLIMPVSIQLSIQRSFESFHYKSSSEVRKDGCTTFQDEVPIQDCA
jgi:peptide chain release factor subunit 1